MEPVTTRSAGGIVLGDGGTIALVKNADGDGAWLFPKGHIEAEETDEEAARREILEETGLTDLEYLDDLGSYTRPRIAQDGSPDPLEQKDIHMFLFAAPKGAVLAPTHEIAEAIWKSFAHVAETIGNATDRFWFAGIAPRVREAIQRD